MCMLDIQIIEDKRSVGVYTPSWIVRRPLFSLHVLPQVPFVCLPNLKLQVSSLATQHFAMVINLGPALSS